MKKLFITFCLLCLSGTTFAATRYVTTQTPLPKNYYNNYQIQDYNYNKLADVEMSMYGRTFQNQGINVRLNRLEQSVFNKTYPNSTVEQRINNLIVNYNNNTNLTPVNNSNSKLRNIINSVSSNFFGCPTGLTPPVNPYYSYGSNGYGSNYGNYQDYYGNNGWYRNNRQFGTGTGIHILD